MKLKTGCRPPGVSQYPLKPEAEQGIERTTDGLLQSGVLVETCSEANTPVLPELKADKSKYRLVHGLRAVNEVVDDFDAEVPDPHTLLTNVPQTAKYFSVIDLCSAFFKCDTKPTVAASVCSHLSCLAVLSARR